MQNRKLGNVTIMRVIRFTMKQRLLRIALFTGLSLTAAGCITGAIVYTLLVPTIPSIKSVEDYQPRLGTKIYSADGQLIGEFAAERRVVVPYEKIPIRLVQAFISAEDQRFFVHHGIDYFGVASALVQKIMHPENKLRGASTITQQVAKSFLVEYEGYQKATERSVWRKVREAILARRLEQALTKEEILYLYLNQIYLGHKAYGVQAAAEHYFRKNVWELSLEEIATVAGLPQRPSDYSPYSNREKAKARRRYVLGRMLVEHFITQDEFDKAAAADLRVYPRIEHFLEIAPYFTEQARREVIDRFGEKALLEDGLQVYTTMDPSKQYYAQRALYHGLQDLDKRQGYRAPLVNIPKKKWNAFLQEVQDDLVLPLEEGTRYLALITKFDHKEKTIQIKIGDQEGIIPLPAMRWARKPNSEKHYEKEWVEKPWKAFKRGDVVLVSLTSRRDLVNQWYAWDELKTIPKDNELPLFKLEQDPIAQGAILSVDARNGYVVAMVGGYDFFESTLNRTMQACRQPGSAFKPIIYSAAIDKKDFTPSTIIIDSPIVEDDPENELRWKPNNAGMNFHGDTPIRTCLKDSMNICSIKVLREVGVHTAIEYAHRLGITTDLTPDLSLALGSSCVTLWDLVNVYTTLNRLGEKQPLHFIKRIINRHGEIIYDNSATWDPINSIATQFDKAYRDVNTKPEMLMDQQTAFIMTRMLYNVVQEGTATRAKQLNKPAYGKTGTTNDSFDAWFMGFTHDYVTGVWVGHDLYERPLGVREYGGAAALPIWLEYMKKSLRGKEQKEFEPPTGVIGKEIDPENGLLAQPDTPNSVMEYYRTGTEPQEFSKRNTNLANENIYFDDVGM